MAAPFPHAGEAMALASSLLWAVAGVVFARLRPTVTPGAINLGKNTTGVLCFAVLFSVLHGRPWPLEVTGDQALLFAASGLVGLTLCDTFFLRALRTLGPQRATLLMTFSTVLAALASLLPPFSESPPPLAWAGMGVCLAGVVLAARARHPDPVRDDEFRRGARDGLVAAALQAAGAMFSRAAFLEDAPTPAAGAAIRLAAGVVGLLVLGFATGRVGRWTRGLAAHGSWWRLGIAAVIGTFLGIWAHVAALGWSEHTGVATTLNSLAPVFLIPLSALFLAERFGARAWLSTLLAVAGIALLSIA
jgi:drug/metabolite transporter (DMT)-like permease